MQALGRGLSRLIHFTTVLGVLAVTLMMLHITIDVVVRNIFGITLPGTIAAVSNFYMLVVAFLPLAYAEEADKHISVEVVTELMPARVQGPCAASHMCSRRWSSPPSPGSPFLRR
ncbi:TRAP transporter small permease [Tistrella bauzanensis]